MIAVFVILTAVLVWVGIVMVRTISDGTLEGKVVLVGCLGALVLVEALALIVAVLFRWHF